MKIELKITKEFDVKFLQVEAGARYWEDGTINGIDDVNGDLTPCREGDYWKPLIEIDSGKILNWKQGTKAELHYKVVDDGTYVLLDENKKIIKEIDGYVPDIMCPEGEGYGDYIIMNIDENGIIAKWNPTFEEFQENEE